MSKPIPQPPTKPIIGNLLDLTMEDTPIESIERIIDIHGPIFKFTVGGTTRVIVANYNYLNQLCDPERFEKGVGGGLAQVSGGKAAGLFAARNEDPDWHQAHRILMPAFGPLAIQGMYDEMHDIASQLVLKWSRMGPNARINVTEDFTRLTLDTIALCAMDYRFNSFYQDEMHPFVGAMIGMLEEAGNRAKRGAALTKLTLLKNKKFQANIELQRQIANEIVARRRNNPTEKKDLLNTLIYGKDPKTGAVMRDDLITANMTTFLIAGHETTSGMLSFAFLLMLQNRRAYNLAQKEVDEVCGRRAIKVEDLKKLKYINAVLRETLRLYPTAPGFSKQVKKELRGQRVTLNNGEYELNHDEPIQVLLGRAHRDPAIYGDDANDFRPERMLDEKFEKLPKNAWKPFGDGVRACIGRAFAWQEALLVTAILLQRFNFELDDPNYKLRLKQALTIKPADLYMRARLRGEGSATSLEKDMFRHNINDDGAGLKATNGATNGAGQANGSGETINIIYGSNTGTCEALSSKMSYDATLRKMNANVTTMDSACDHINVSQPLIVVTSSYEGQPPDNAAGFMQWLESQPEGSMKGLRFAVFGCGNSDWASTYQAVPKQVEQLLTQKGGKSIFERGSSDAVTDDIYEKFDQWSAKVWPNITSAEAKADESQGMMIDVRVGEDDRAKTLRHDVQEAKVLSVHTLTEPGEPEKRHMEIQLPEEMHYSCGDYLAVLPTNPMVNVKRVLKKFGLPWHATITISSKGQSTLPVDKPLSVADVLAGYVELGQQATKKHILYLASLAKDPGEKSLLEQYAEYAAGNTAKRRSLLDLLEASPSVKLDFGAYLSMLPPLRVRHYSISSSPLAGTDPSKCSITYGVVSDAETKFVGVAGNHLKSLSEGDTMLVSVRPRRKGFELPLEVDKVPLLMFCAGTGLAPFRGFLEERKILAAAGRQLAPAMLFVGCRNSSGDRLYAQDMDKIAYQGVCDIRYAFSRQSEKSEGCKYVQDRMMKDRQEVTNMWKAGAKVYICGTKAFSKEIGKAAREIVRENQVEKYGSVVDEAFIENVVQKFQNDRVVSDVFS